MNNYRVRIRNKNGCMFDVNEIKGAMKHLKSRMWFGIGMSIDEYGVFAEGLEFVTGQEDMAMSVYAKAKRNLDPKKYMVTLELPKEDRKPRHLGSC